MFQIRQLFPFHPPVVPPNPSLQRDARKLAPLSYALCAFIFVWKMGRVYSPTEYLFKPKPKDYNTYITLFSCLYVRACFSFPNIYCHAYNYPVKATRRRGRCLSFSLREHPQYFQSPQSVGRLTGALCARLSFLDHRPGKQQPKADRVFFVPVDQICY